MKLVVIFLQYDTKKYPGSFDKMHTRIEKIKDCDKKYLIVDNFNEDQKEEKLSKNITIIGGDNSSWEFSAWDKGISYLKIKDIAFDVVLLVNDSFLVDGWTFLDKAAEFNLAKIAFNKTVAIGHVDTKGYSMDLLGNDVTSWIRTNALFLPKKIVDSLEKMVSVNDKDLDLLIPKEFSKKYFYPKANIGTSYKDMVIKWLTEDWHSKIEITEKNWQFFRKKTQEMFNESLLTARIKKLGFKIVPYFEIKEDYETAKHGLLYKFYKKKIKMHIPKKFFLITNLFLDTYHKVMSSYLVRMINKYFGLAKLATQEFKMGGFPGLFFALKRHLKKRKGILIVPYPTKNDYEKNLVSIGILNMDNIDSIKACIESIEKNLSSKYKTEILIGDTGSQKRATWKYYKEISKKYENIKVVKFKKYFYSKNYNDLFRNYANGNYLIALEHNITFRTNWLDKMIQPLLDKKIGAVGGKILFQDGTIKSAGIEIKEDLSPYQSFLGKNNNIAEANFIATVPALSLECLAIRHDVYDRFQLEEKSEKYICNLELCFSLKQAGFDIVYNPQVSAYTSSKFPTENFFEKITNTTKFKIKWGKYLHQVLENKKQRKIYNINKYKDAIVIIRDDGIGDILMGISAFQSLRDKNPNKKIIFLTYERNIEMMAGFNIFDEILPIPDGKKYSPLPIPTLGTKIYDFIDLEMHFGNFFATTKETNKIHRHEIFKKELGIESPYKIVPMPNYPEAKAHVLEIIKKMGYSQSSPFVVFSLTASNHARSWWYPYYSILALAVKKMGFIPLVIGTRGIEHFKGVAVVNLVGKTKTIAEYIEAIKLGKYVISTDTSAYHIAALSGIPFLAIFTGGVLPESRLSLYSKYEVVAPPKTLSCYPCWDEGCKDLSIRHKKEPCRMIIQPEEVIKNFEKLIKKYPIKK